MAVVFDYGTWAARFPLLGAAPSAFVTSLVPEAMIYVDTGPRSPIPVDEQQVVFNLVLAHLVALNTPIAGGAASQGLVGRITSTSEGSVSVSLDAGQPASLTQAWWLGTTYGQQVWVLLSRYRRFRYVPGFPRVARQNSLNRIA